MAEAFLRWVGGKRQLVTELLKHLPPVQWNDYYEPFVGGGAFFFALQKLVSIWAKGSGPSFNVTLNDANPHLIEVYRQVRGHVSDVIRELGHLDESMKKRGLPVVYADIRMRFNQASPMISAARSAAWFIAMNAWGFNGLCRYNRSGGFNVPVGKFTKIPVLMDKADNLRAVATVLQDVKILGGDFAKTVEHAKKGDLVYFDPPYIPVGKTADFTSYTSGGFDMSHQRRLMCKATDLVDKGVHVILSNSDTPTTRALYAGNHFTLHEVQARRAVNSNASKRGKVGELIIVGRS
jgi:DNA adenine methylase